jgi:glycosyltransferase involved in cell wall biosynthesis
MAYLNEFYTRYKDYDVIVMNPGVDLVHPEFLYKYFPNAIKCLHFIDDPHMTYSYCLPFAWAFDCATYVSPSYSEDYTMEQILNLSGFKHTKWFPHCVSNNFAYSFDSNQLKESLINRENKIIYVGNSYTSKNKRLQIIKNKFGKRFDIYGNYPFFGLLFPVISTFSGYPSAYRIKPLTNYEREQKYKKYAIGLNLHLSNPSIETGNARLYELAYRGVAQVVDSSKVSAVGSIFKPDIEILTYNNVDECIFQLDKLLNNQDLRISLATAAYERAINEYSYENVINATCEWFSKIRFNN